MKKEELHEKTIKEPETQNLVLEIIGNDVTESYAIELCISCGCGKGVPLTLKLPIGMSLTLKKQ